LLLPTSRCTPPALCCVLLLVPSAASSLPLTAGEQIQLGLLLQPALLVQRSDSGSPTFDPHLQRALAQLWGSRSELSFYSQAGVTDLGLQADWTPALSLLDAWVEWSPGERLQIDAGLFLPPWAHHAMQHDGSRLLPLDHDELLSYPAGPALRDLGLQARGRLLGGRLEYRLAGSNGVQVAQGHELTDYDGDGEPDPGPLNPDDLPRVTARLAWSFFEPSTSSGAVNGWYHGRQLALGSQGLTSPARLLSAGVAVDHQQDALYVEQRDHTGSVSSATRADYTALTGDLHADLPLRGGQRSLNLLVAGFWYPLDDHPEAGTGLLAEAGYRMGRWQPLFSYKLRDADTRDSYDHASGWLGVDYWPQGPSGRVSLLLGAIREGGGTALQPEGRLQAQLWF